MQRIPERDVLVRKGERHAGSWLRTRRRLAAGAGVFLAAIAAPAAAQKKAPAAPEKATGAIVQFEETRQRGILYLEEGGGMMTRPPAPVAAERDEAPKAARMELKPEERATSISTGTGISAKRPAQRRDAAVVLAK